MLVVCLIIGFALCIVGVCVNKNIYDDAEISLFTYIGGITLALSFLIIMSGVSHIAEEKTINGQIDLYEQENAQIEIEINNAIDEYVRLERNGSKKTSSTILTTLVAMYPEVCDNVLVQSKINAYIKNSNEIILLKEEVLQIKTWKWWVCFG